MSSESKRRPQDPLDPNSQITRKLRELYQSIEDERIPDRFLDLLEKLDEAENANASADKQRK